MSDRDPYEDGLEVVWRDPMGYDMREHGPPYFPVTAAQRAEGREFAMRSAAYYDVGPRLAPQEGTPYDILAYMLAALRTLGMVHQTAHWQVRGGHFYGDHLLFERLYGDNQEGIDSVAERLLGLTGDPEQVNILAQIRIMQKMIRIVHTGHEVGGPESSNQLVQCSLKCETLFLGGLAYAKKCIEGAGALSDGLEDLIQGIASKHEEFVYLLKQRAASCGGHGPPTEKYSYDRRG